MGKITGEVWVYPEYRRGAGTKRFIETLIRAAIGPAIALVVATFSVPVVGSLGAAVAGLVAGALVAAILTVRWPGPGERAAAARLARLERERSEPPRMADLKRFREMERRADAYFPRPPGVKKGP